MSKRALYGYLAFLGGLVLFALSPLASLGGFVVAIALVMPLGVILGLMGMLEPGSGFDNQLDIIFWAWIAIMVMLAFWQLYRGAGFADEGNRDRARVHVALAATLVVVPAVVVLCYQALGL